MTRRLTPFLVDTFRRELPVASLAIVEGLSTHLVEWARQPRVPGRRIPHAGDEGRDGRIFRAGGIAGVHDMGARLFQRALAAR